MDRSKNRSDSYQWKLLELSCSPEMLAEVADSEGIYDQLNPFGYNEELLDLKDRLKAAFWRIVDTKLTKRQKEVLHLYCEENTQTEIAKQLGVNQSSITKSMNGNCDYKNGRRMYGGSKRKISKLAEKDEEVQEILKRMQEIRSNNIY